MVRVRNTVARNAVAGNTAGEYRPQRDSTIDNARVPAARHRTATVYHIAPTTGPGRFDSRGVFRAGGTGVAAAMLDLRGNRGAERPRVILLRADGEPGGTMVDDGDAARDPIRAIFGVFPMRNAAEDMYALARRRRVRIPRGFNPHGSDDVMGTVPGADSARMAAAITGIWSERTGEGRYY